MARGVISPLGDRPLTSYLFVMVARSRNLAETSSDLVLQTKSRQRARVKVGGVFVFGDKASAAEVRMSVAKSTEALVRLGKKIAKPGVRLYPARDVPLFSADPEHPDRVIRKLNGRIDRGVLENGAFKVID